MSIEYSTEKPHPINAEYGICWERPRTVNGNDVGDCWRVYHIASGRDDCVEYKSADKAVAAAGEMLDILVKRRAARAEKAAAPAKVAVSPAAVVRAPRDAAYRAHRVGRSLGVSGGIWDESEM